MKNQIVKSIICYSLFSILQPGIKADSFKGTISSSSYYFTRQNKEKEQITHLRMHESFRFQYHPTFQKNLLINSSGVFYFDPLHSAIDGDPTFNLFAFNAQYKRLFNLFDVTAGRIFIYDPSNSGRIDGIHLIGKIRNRIKYSAYGGGFVFSNGEFSNPVENHLLGMNLNIPIQSETKLGLAISQKAHHREIYKRGIKNIEVPNVAERRLGVQIITYVRNFSIYWKAVQDLHWMNIQEINFVTSYSKSAMQKISFTYYFRRPRINYNSIFSVFDAQTNQEFAISGLQSLKSNWRLFSKVRLILFSDTKSLVFNVGLGWRNISTQYQYQQGYGGDYHRMILRGQYRPFHRLLLRGNVNLGNYKPLKESWENLTTLSAGLTYQVMKHLNIKIELHSLQNRYYKKDVRLWVHLTYLLP